MKNNIEDLYRLFLICSSVSIDSRHIPAQSLFFALKGPSFNGNLFAKEALEKGALYAVVDDASVRRDDRYIVVDDVLKTLQALAAYHRQQFTIPVIGITGSNGKTTTKELVNIVLQTHYKTYFTQGNLNNHIGVPLTLLSIRKESLIDIAIIEMGANKQGDIHELCMIAQPTHGIITNIGKAHLEGFKGIEGVKKGKGELYAYIYSHQGSIFVNACDSTLMTMSEYIKNRILYGKPNTFYTARLLKTDPFVSYETESGQAISTYLIGAHNFNNILAALCVASYFKVPLEKAHEAIAHYIPSSNRSQLIKQGSNTIILDAYNANPTSMQAAIESFKELQAESKCIILGDMLELGEESEKEHMRLGELVANSTFDIILFTGKEMRAAVQKCQRAYYFPDPFSLRNWLMDKKLSNYHILIKGSRGMKLEELVPFIS